MVSSTVGRLNRDILRAMRFLYVELKLLSKYLVCIPNVISTIINESPKNRLGHDNDGTSRTSFAVSPGIRPRRALV